MKRRRKKRARLALLRFTFAISLLALVLSVCALFLLRNGRTRYDAPEGSSPRVSVRPADTGNSARESGILQETVEPKPQLQMLPGEADTAPQSGGEGAVIPEAQGTAAVPEAFRLSREKAGLTEQRIETLRAENSGRYYYDRLDAQEQRLYAELYHIMATLGEDVFVSAKDTEVMEKVQNCVMNDHPEIFYVNGYYTTRYTIGGETAGYAFTGRYQYDAAEIQRRNTLIEQYMNTALAGINPAWDDYGKIRYIYDYLIAHTSYDLNAADNQNVCSVMIGGVSVCQGYAKAAQMLLARIGIPATLVAGTARTSDTTGPHAWNLVMADGNWYYLDVTWGDASFRDEGGPSDGINYDYLLTTTADISATHTIGSVVPMPVCDHLEDNYYVREGAYFTDASLDAFAALTETRRSQGEECVRFKCATQEVYNAIVSRLIDEKRIFDYIYKAPGESMLFSRSDAQRTFTVWF